MTSIFAKHKAPDDIVISCFGEVLWDYFADGKRLGGAPLNVCLRLNSLGIHADILSAVGDDALGRELIDAVKDRGLGVDNLSVDAVKKTSLVDVVLDESGSASYQIVADTAWDNIVISQPLMDKVASSDIFVFGSLIARNDTSLTTLRALIAVSKFNIFDVNLRKPHYNLATLIELMNAAHCIKLNDDELYEIAAEMGSKFKSLEQNVEFIAEKTATEFICVTKGRHGALLKIGDKKYYNSGYLINVVDTVGAGDAFLGSLIYQLCCDTDPQYAVDFACAVGAMVAEHQGATPVLGLDDIANFMSPA